MKELGKKGYKAATKEIKQLHELIVFNPISIEELIIIEKQQAMESLIFLMERKMEKLNQEHVQTRAHKENTLTEVKQKAQQH
jgi:hypothetical protein